MDVKLDDRWKDFVEQEVEQGRFESADALVAEGLRLVVDREAKLSALRDLIASSIRRGGEASEDDINRALAARADELRRVGLAG